jgi:MinD-like ATPase involved in chromosome partitioning or flagellar assembly
MKITVYQAKGAAGKTPIATNIALDREYAIGTNEAFHVYDSFIPDERLLALDLSESFPDIPNDIDIVFDLAGSISAHSHSITSAIKQSDLVIVPIYNEVKSLHGGIGTLREIAKLGYNRNILVVATKLKKGKKEQFDKDWTQSNDFQNIVEAVKEAGFSADVLPLKLSAVFDVIFEKEKSIRQLRETDPLAAYTYRDIAAQFDEIYSYIDGVNHAQQEQSLRA